MSLTKNLIEDLKSVNGSEESFSKLQESLYKGGERSRKSLEGGLNVEEVDFEELVHEFIPESDRNVLMNNHVGEPVFESTISAITSTQLPNLLGTLIRVGLFSVCPESNFALSGLVQTIRAGCGQMDFYGYHELGDVVDDDVDELEPTRRKGIPRPTKVSQPGRSKKKFAMGITREFLCFDVNQQAREMMRRGRRALALHKEKLLVDVVYNLYGTGVNPFRYIEDDVQYETYYSAVGGPYINRLVGNNLDGTFAPFDTLDFFAETLTDPKTGEPIDCDFPVFLGTNLNQLNKARMGLNVVSIEADGTQGTHSDLANPKITQGRGPIGRYSIREHSRYAISRVKQYFMDVHSLSASDAEKAAKEMYLVGDFNQAFAWVEEWPEETLERAGTDKYEYFEQEIVWQIKFMTKADPMVLDPRKVIQCVPGTETVATLSWT